MLNDEPAAWGEFVLRYTGLILAMARRYLRTRDGDEVRTVFVGVLVSLRRTRLRTYEGRASLSTWLTLVTRSEVIDHLRREFGRDRAGRTLRGLSSSDRAIYRWFYIEGRSPSEILASLRESGLPQSHDEFDAALDRIEKLLGSRWLRRLAYDLHARSVGAASGRMLEYLDHVREEFRHHAGASSPEYQLMERDARRTVEALRAAMTSLEGEERRLLELRFERGWTADRIATELGMSGQRSVYTSLERIFRRLRRQLTEWRGT